MASTLQFIYNAESPNQGELLEKFLGTMQAIIPDFVRGDQQIAITIRPVVPSLTDERPWDDDFLSGDTFTFAIGNADLPSTGGTFALTINGNSTGLGTLSYGISATDLQTAVNAVLTTEAIPLVTVTEPTDGVYVLTANSNGVGPTTFEGDGANLIPDSDVIPIIVDAGGVSSRWRGTIAIRQQNVVLANPATTLPSAGVTRTYTQSASSTQNSIIRISFDAPGTYGGVYSIAAIAGGVSQTCGVVGPLATPEEVGQVLANHPGINFQSTDGSQNNVSITQDGDAIIIEPIDNLSGPSQTSTITTSSVANPSVITITGSATTDRWKTGDTITISGHTGSTPSINGNHIITVLSASTFSIPVNVTVGGTGGTAFNTTEGTFTVTNVNLLAPKGVTGVVNLNTFNLYNAFWATDPTTTPSLTFTLEIQRTRASGEVRTGVRVSVTIWRDIIDATSLVPITIPTALTQYTGISFYGGVDAYIGSASALDAVATISITPPILISFIHSVDGLRFYELLAGTDVESSPNIIRPDDYAVGTNEKYWQSVG